MELVQISRELARAVDALKFGAPITHVYNPLRYARRPHELYLERFGRGKKRVLLVGMNPGPFGMAQSGVPFGDIPSVRDWLGISAAVDKPEREHPKRPVLGFECPRCEVSGTRLWGWARDTFGTPEQFFSEFFVVNYCPLVFMEESGRNRTPDKLPLVEREPLLTACDEALRRIVHITGADYVIGVGAFAEQRARTALQQTSVRIGTILHPSPASPKANSGWDRIVTQQLRSLGIPLGADFLPDPV